MTDTPCTIGRSGQCDIVLPLPEVSRVHAVFSKRGKATVIEDRSRNGLTVNGLPARSATVEPGDEVRIAAYTLRVGPAGSAGAEGAGSDSQSTVPAGKGWTRNLSVAAPSPDRLGEMVGASEPMRRIYAQVRKLAASAVPVLILGETGTGKELVARALHSLGPTVRGPWVAVNCAAIAPELVETELFGHEKGAFTGAYRRREGAFVAARGGTLFLDEIGEMPLPLQPKLLRALESSEIVRVGGREPLSISARVIAATNRNLAEDAETGRFRKDLYYRLCVVPVSLPRLSERGDDVIMLARHLIAEEGGVDRFTFTPEALDFLRSYTWPGNVRELRNLIRRLLAQETEASVDSGALRLAIEADRMTHAPLPAANAAGTATGPAPSTLGAGDRPASQGSGAGTLREMERLAILRALQDCRGNKQAVARRLGIAPGTLYDKIRRYGICAV